MLRANLQAFLFGATASLSAGYYFLHQDIWRSADLLSESVGSMVNVSASKTESLEKRVAKLEGEVAALKVRAAATAWRVRVAPVGSRTDASATSLTTPLRPLPRPRIAARHVGRRQSAEDERAAGRRATWQRPALPEAWAGRAVGGEIAPCALMRCHADRGRGYLEPREGVRATCRRTCRGPPRSCD